MATWSFRSFVERKMGKFAHFVIYALLEWIMIILLFVDGFIALLATQYAKLFELRMPCVLCTRIDHILIRRRSRNAYYNESICESHKKNVSSLAYCHVHRKLSDIRAMCEGCLLSFATGKDSDLNTYKSLVGILHKDIECFVDDRYSYPAKSVRTAKDDIILLGNDKTQRCSCCGEPLRMSSSSKLYNRSASMTARTLSQAPASSPRASAPLEGRNLELTNLRYTELKFISDHVAEIPEDETGSNGECREEKVPPVPLPSDADTPNFTRGNRFFGIPLSDSAQASPRFVQRNPRKLLFEKSDMITESNEASGANEADRDSILHCLKRQVRLDHKSLIAVYMELDEERSASAVAANNAMAMITKLQAEKAAVQMEALQYQRMMEEQAEYDQEALQVMKDVLDKREDEVKVLEAELDNYKEKYGDMKKIGSEECEADFDDDYQELKSQGYSFTDGKSDHEEGEHNLEQPRENGEGIPDDLSLDFEGEKSFLMGLLKGLEKKIHASTDAGTKNSSESDVNEHENVAKGMENEASLTREVSFIRERLRAVEAESGFLKHAAMTLQRGNEGTKLLTEIAQHLRELRTSQ